MNRGFITPAYSLNGIQSADMDPFILGIESILRQILPEDFLNPNKKKVAELKKKLPILHLHLPQTAPCTVSVYTLFPGEFTGGVGRYIADTLSHWIVPGKFINICAVHSLNFFFSAHPVPKFFYMHCLIDVYNTGDLAVITSNWTALKQEICLNVLAVKHARQIMSVKKLSFEQKQALIEEHISSVIDRPSKDVDLSSFDQMHHILMQITAEKRLKQIKEQFLSSFEQRPKAFQRDIFHELKHFVLLFGEKFTTLHPLTYVKRLVSYQYIFRKSLLRLIASAPGVRHLAIKLIKIQFPARKAALGIFGALNVLRENELFEERHLIQAIRHSLPSARAIENTFLLDRHSHDPIRIFYIEIEKKEGSDFKKQEIQQLQKNLTREIKENIESAIHPVFMPRNEEEIMRNMLLLSQQLKYVTDLPQVIISFDAQIENDLVFRVILLRILRAKKELFPASNLILRDHEVKNIGLLRKKYVKEANVFKVLLNKEKFLRKDFTIDLFKARQALSSELERMFKGIRDFNGGILSKQQEAFSTLRALLKDAPSHKDFLLENFFYSLTPSLHQNLVPPSVLKALFLLTLEALEAQFHSSAFFIKKQCIENQLLCVIASPNPRLKEILFPAVQSLALSNSELAVSHVSSYEIESFNYIYCNPCPDKQEAFYRNLKNALLNASFG